MEAWLGVLGVMVMPYHLEHWWSRVGAVIPAISVSFVTLVAYDMHTYEMYIYEMHA